ncbi:MAG TPA: tetratricopeptide repeat protein [Candidatus Aquilonibacter sp.]|nr:tetratricopeptide repeat protein [Candidatus Aquilonibacter sp.]
MAIQSGEDSAQIQEHLRKANQYLQHKQPALAIPEFAAVVAADPKNLDAQANLGVLLYFTGQPQEAEPHLRSALAIDPKEIKLQALLGFCEHRGGQLQEARNDLSSAFPSLQDPKVRRQAGLELVEIDTSLSDLPAAAIIVSQLKVTFPTDPEILYAAYRVYTDLADEALLDLSVAAPDSAQMHQAMAHELLRERDSDAAIANMRAALKIDPNLPGGHFELAEELHASSEPAQKAQAEDEYKLAIEQNPRDAAAFTRLGDIAADREDHEAALARYKQALAIQPDNEDAAIGLAYELTETGHPDAALPLLKQVVKADPTNVLAHYRLSAVYRRLRRMDDAKREVAEYERLKAMKEKLRNIYQAMRMASPQGSDAKE